MKQSATLESTLSFHANSQASYLLRVQSEVSGIRVPLRNIDSSLSGLESQVRYLNNELDERFRKLESLVAAATQRMVDNHIVDRDRQEVGSTSTASQASTAYG